MTTWESFDIVLAVLVLPLAFWTIAARETFVAVVSYVAYGLLLALVWVRLGAPDVALAVAAIGSGLSGVLLLFTAARLRDVGGGSRTGRRAQQQQAGDPAGSQQLCGHHPVGVPRPAEHEDQPQ